MTLTGGIVSYLWGLSGTDADNYGCPIRIFLSKIYLTWNKIKFSFKSEYDFPGSNGYKLIMDANGASYITDISIFTDVPVRTNSNIECYST